MPRRARLDFPGTLHHVICRGIEKRDIVAEIEAGDLSEEDDYDISTFQIVYNKTGVDYELD